MNNLFSYLMAPPEDGQSPFGSLFFIILIIVIFYLFMIRPQQKKMREAKKFRDSLKKGNKVVTIGGIHGKIESISETTITITTAGGGKLKVEKSAVSAENSASEVEISQRK